MTTRMLAAGTLAAMVGLSGVAIAAEDVKVGDGPATVVAPKPAADTKEPGKTATDAVTHPSAVPPSEGAPGTGTSPTTGSDAGAPAR